MKKSLELTEEETNRFWNLVKESTKLWEEEKKYESNAKKIEAIFAIPEPRELYDVSFVASGSLGRTFILVQDLDEAAKWVDFNQMCCDYRPETGEREMLKGVLLFEQGNFVEAKEAFTVGDLKSQKR